jgi:hypothetical protein
LSASTHIPAFAAPISPMKESELDQIALETLEKSLIFDFEMISNAKYLFFSLNVGNMGLSFLFKLIHPILLSLAEKIAVYLFSLLFSPQFQEASVI